MLHVQTLRRLIAAAQVQRDPYAVAEAATALLRANPADALVLQHYALALETLGLRDAARRAGKADAAGGLIPWSSRARRYNANLAALLARYPQYASLMPASEALAERYELHLASDGNALVFNRAAKHVWDGWLLGLADHRAAIASWQFDKRQNPTPMPAVFDGAGYGWLLPHALATTANSFLTYSCAFYLVEPDPAALAILLHLHDWQALLTAPRLRLFIGPSAGDDSAKAFATQPTWTIPTQVITHPLTRAPLGQLQGVCEDCTKARAARRSELVAQNSAYYAHKDAAYWARRFDEAAAGGPKLRVLGLTSRFTTVLQHSMEELRQAVAAAGAEMLVAKEPDDHSMENPFLEMIAEFKPDLIVQISRMRYEQTHLPANVPFLCWDQDNLPCMRTPAATASLDALTYVAGHGANYGYSHLNWPRRNVIFCHPAAATFRYSTAPVAGREKFACDFSYVSNAAEAPEALRARLATRWPDGLFMRLGQRVHEASAAGATWDYLALQKLAAEAGVTGEALRELTHDLNVLADRCFRHTTLGWVSRWCAAHGKTLRIYGAGWEQHATLAAYAAGSAQQGEELRAIYQASRINLQIIEPGFLHSRALDGVAAGGFFLTRRTIVDGVGSEEVASVYALAQWCREHGFAEERITESRDPQVQRWWQVTQDYFTRHGVRWVLSRALETWAEIPPACLALPQLAEITFATEAEFAALAETYLADASLRQRRAAEMRALVERDFSYPRRWQQFLHGVRQGLAAGAK